MKTFLPLEATTGGAITLSIRVLGSVRAAYESLRKALSTDDLPDIPDGDTLAEGQLFAVHVDRILVVEERAEEERAEDT